jgi:saccharopine dehydrogenase (NAD+, L-lysine-forming)
MHGLTCAGAWVTGSVKHGAPREVYLHDVVDNEWSMAEYGSQAVVWQTAVNPVLMASWTGPERVFFGPEGLPPLPFLDLLADSDAPWDMAERRPT